MLPGLARLAALGALILLSLPLFAAAPGVTFSPFSFFANEEAGEVTISVRRDGTGAGFVTYSTAPGTATAGTDYVPVTGAVSWMSGEIGPKTFTIPLIDDPDQEPEETFTVSLGASNFAIRQGTAVVRILASDLPPVPTASEWGLIVLGAVLALAGVYAIKR